MPIILDPAAPDPPVPSSGLTRLDLENEVLAHGFNALKYRERVRRWLNAGVRWIRRNSELPEAEDEQVITTVAGAQSVALDELTVGVRWLRNSEDHAELEQWNLRDVDDASAASGKPYAYARSGRNIVFYPTPDAAYALEARVYLSADEMVDDAAEPALPVDYHDLLVPFALSRAYRSEDDAEMSAFFWNEFLRDFTAAKTDLQRGKPPRQVPGMWAVTQGPSFVRP